MRKPRLQQSSNQLENTLTCTRRIPETSTHLAHQSAAIETKMRNLMKSPLQSGRRCHIRRRSNLIYQTAMRHPPDVKHPRHLIPSTVVRFHHLRQCMANPVGSKGPGWICHLLHLIPFPISAMSMVHESALFSILKVAGLDVTTSPSSELMPGHTTTSSLGCCGGIVKCQMKLPFAADTTFFGPIHTWLRILRMA